MGLLNYLFAITLIAIFVFLVLLQWKSILPTRLIIFDHEIGLLYQNGRFKKALGPGTHFIYPFFSQVEKFDLRQTQLIVSGQEILSLDNVSLKVSVNCFYRIEDALLAKQKVVSYQETLYAQIQLILRDIIGARTIEKLLEEKQSINQELSERIKAMASQYGLSILEISIKDISFPGELKRIFSEVIRAQKEGQAALERARGESAALRNLANAAKMIEEHPVLMNLRLLQSLSSNQQNTLVLGLENQFSHFKK